MHARDEADQAKAVVRAILEHGLAGLQIASAERLAEPLTELVLLLDRWAARINLTGHRTPEAIAARLVLDAVALATALPELASSQRVADLGTGAGFPGLPLAVLRPETEVVLVDSRRKRHHFQRAAARALGLANVTPLLGRSDEIEPHASDLVIAQAMAQPDVALPMMAQWASPGAVLALPASADAAPPAPPSGFEAPSMRTYEVPGTGVARRVWVLRAIPRS